MNAPRFFYLSFLVIALALTANAARNLVFNGGFELGTAGFEIVRYQDITRNPTMVYEDLIVDITQANVHSGAHALRVPNQHGENSELFARSLMLKPGTRYAVSVWMKSQSGNLAAA